jgi:hypothetical protein
LCVRQQLYRCRPRAAQVKLSFAEKAVVVDKQPVPQGLFLGGDVSLFGLLDTTVKLQLTTSGATFGLTVDDTQLVKASHLPAPLNGSKAVQYQAPAMPVPQRVAS